MAALTCRRTAGRRSAAGRAVLFGEVTTQPAGPSWSQGCARSQSAQSASNRAAVTSVASSGASLAAGLSVRRVNPNKLRQFARARAAKNDRLDARLIAEYVAIMPTRVVERNVAVERLAEIVTDAAHMPCDEHVAVENQAGHLERCHAQATSKRRLIRTGRPISASSTSA